MSNLYLAYGSNMSRGQMLKRCPSAEFERSLVLSGRKLFFDRVANMVPSQDDICPVVLWRISDEDLMKLDVYEGHPLTYCRKSVKLSDGTKCYVYIKQFVEPKNPRPEYVQRIKTGYYENGFDDLVPSVTKAAMQATYRKDVRRA